MDKKRIFALVVVSILILVGLVTFADPKELMYTLSNADSKMLLLSLASYSVAIIVFAGYWHLLLKPVNLKLSFENNLKVVFSSVFFNVVTPTASYGGEVVRAYLLSRRYEQDFGLGVSTIVAHRIIGTFSNVFATFFAALYLIAFYSIPPLLLVIIFGTSAVALAGFMIFLYLGLDLEKSRGIMDRVFGTISRYRGISRERKKSIVESLESYNKGLKTLLMRRDILVISLILGVCAWFFVNLVAVFSFMALGVEMNLEYFIVIFTFFSVSRMIPTGLPEFVGSKEAILAGLFAIVGFSAVTSVGVMLLIRVATQLWMVVLGGFITLTLGFGRLDRRELEEIEM